MTSPLRTVFLNFRLGRNRPGKLGWMALLLIVFAAGSGCKKAPPVAVAPPPPPESSAPTAAVASPATVAPAAPPSAAPVPAGQPDLAELNRAMLRWLMGHHRTPANFEEFAATAGVPIAPPPPGKKYQIRKDMHVVLVDR